MTANRNIKRRIGWSAAVLAGTAACALAGDGFKTGEDAMLEGLGDWDTEPVFTVGEAVDDYRPVGILDGIGATRINGKVVRVLVNHELTSDRGHAYRLANGTYLTGARVSFFDVDKNTREIVDAGLAYDTVYDRAGKVVTDDEQLNGDGDDVEGINRLCSSQLVEKKTFGFRDTIFLTGEETGGGTEYALDVENGELWACPDMGRAAWENVTPLDTGDKDTIALLIGDDRGGAPLLLYVGETGKKKDGFLKRNGLSGGKLYAWAADNGDLDPGDWNGTGSSRSGTFVEIDIFDSSQAGNAGWDDQGYALQDTQDDLAASAGAFRFSRPEDVATNPAKGKGHQAVMASTGRSSLFPADAWGTTYLIDVDFSDLDDITAELEILYDGDDAANRDFGIRSPDNLDWADDGLIYVQEDRSVSGFGADSGEEASVWQLDPSDGDATRIAQIDRDSVVPASIAIDTDPNDLGDWESSGILDVTSLFRTKKGQKLFILGVQAHSIRRHDTFDGNNDGNPDRPFAPFKDDDLVEGGQLLFLSTGGDK